MTKEQLQQFEQLLVSAGYKKFNTGLTSKEDYGYFKSWKNDDDNLLYMIEFRIWDFSKYETYPNKDDAYSIDTLILDGDGDIRIDLELSHPKFDIESAEAIAKDLHAMLQPHVERFLSKANI